MKKILVTIPLKREEDKQRFIEAAPGCEFVFTTNEFPDEIIKETNVIIGQPKMEHLKRAPFLKWVQLSSAGADAYVKNKEFFKEIILTNMTGAFGQSVSEYLLTMVLSLYKKMNLYRDLQGQCIWKDRGEEKTLEGKTVLILGAGDIGRSFARLLTIFHTTTIGIRKNPSGTPEYFHEMHTMDELNRLLPRADVVAMSLPSTPSTRKLMDEKRLRLMKKDAVLLNAGRGDAIVLDDLLKVMSEGHLFGAALDVTDPEPLPKDHPLWKQENVIITPHVSGGSFEHLEETYDKILDIILTNLRHYINGEELINQVDLEQGYKKS